MVIFLHSFLVDFNLNFQEMICPLENYFTIMPPDRNLNLGRISKQFASTVADVNTKTIDHRFGTTSNLSQLILPFQIQFFK